MSTDATADGLVPKWGSMAKSVFRHVNQPWSTPLLLIFLLNAAIYMYFAFLIYNIRDMVEITSLLLGLFFLFHFPVCCPWRGGWAGKAGFLLWVVFKGAMDGVTLGAAAFAQEEGRSLVGSDFNALLTADARETTEFLFHVFPDQLWSHAWPWIAAVGALTVLHGVALWWREKGKAPFRASWGGVAAGCLALVVFVGVADSLPALRIAWRVHARRQAQRQQILEMQRKQRARAQRLRDIRPTKDEKGETLLLVIGESASRRYMGAYGYEHDNTPFFSAMHAENRLVLLNAFSCGVMTHVVVPEMLRLTNAYRDGPPGDDLSLFELCNQADIRTAYLSNHSSESMTLLNEITRRADQCRYLYDMPSYTRDQYPGDDSHLLPVLEEYLEGQAPGDNRFIVLHLFGSHKPFARRVPPDFPGRLKEEDFASKTEFEYARTMEYTDDLLRRVVAIMDRKAGQPYVMVYVSDHGEGVSGRFRVEEIARFHPELVEVPVAVYASEAYRRLHPERVARMEDKRDGLFSTDLLPWLVSGLFGLHWEGREEKYDYGSPHYLVREGTLRLFYGLVTIENGEYAMSDGSRPPWRHSPGGVRRPGL